MPDDNDQSNPIDLLTVGDLLSLKEAAEKSGFSVAYLRDIAQNGRLRAKKVGRDWITTLAAVEEYKRTRKFIAKKEEETS